MADAVKLIGLDFGTTTTSAVVAAAHVCRSATGRVEFDQLREIFRSDMVFTPLLADGRLDLDAIDRLLDDWFAAGRVSGNDLFGGGALLTGLTAQKDNAPRLVELIRRRLGDALIATADDPCLESWLAFMANCSELARENPNTAIVNLDIGGGTTNVAFGKSGHVRQTGSLFVGARHLRVRPGTYHVVSRSPYARDLLDHLNIAKDVGDELSAAEVDAFVALQVNILESVCIGEDSPIVKRLEQVRYRPPKGAGAAAVTFSGGVGELVYRHLHGEPWPTTTRFGDLGIDLARRIVASPMWRDSLARFGPKSAGRATVYGLLRYATEIAGSTIHQSAANLLPLADVPIVGRWYGETNTQEIRETLALAMRSERGGCVQVRLGDGGLAVVRKLGTRIADVLQQDAFPADRPLVFLVAENLGKVLGQYATRWGALGVRLIAIDELPLRDAQYVRIGTPHHQAIPVSCFGFLPSGDES